MSLPVKVPILMYHKIERVNRRSLVPGHYVSPSLFKKQMAVLAALGYTPVALSSLYREEVKLPRKPIVITFDDGYVNYLTNALPILQSQKFVATVFLVANLLDGTNVWDVKLGDVEERLMSVDQILECHRLGTEFGSHTLDHADLDAVSKDEARRQIVESKSKLESDLGIPIETFCYPYGRKNRDVMQMVQDAGYRLACSTEKGINIESTDRFALRRINVRRDTSVPVFVMKLLRGQRHER
jgi:peptidoglycan/xylan/chitin deacetylase (PgdA/CDA1 family)